MSKSAGVFKLECASESPGRLVKTQIAETCPRVSDLTALGEDRDFSFLTSSQGMLMPCVQNH